MPRAASATNLDTDGDELGDVCDDDDGDGVLDEADNCALVANTTQEDRDGDGQGDRDLCPRAALDSGSENNDADGDGIGDLCDPCDLPQPRPACDTVKIVRMPVANACKAVFVSRQMMVTVTAYPIFVI